MRTAPSKFWTFLIALFIGLGVTALGAVSPAAADAGITLDKKAPGSVLLGDNIPYELTAKNVSSPAVPQYNIGFSDVLPVGMVYVPGSVSPAIGEPTITINDGRQVLAWTNVSDLQANSTFTITYEAKWPNAGSIPTDITPTDINYATVASQTDPRKVPKFNADGTPTNATNTANDSETTKRAPFIIEKSEPSPEGELLRGVHKKRTVYTLKISNNKVKSTENITVTDYLPAGLEFLGCGDEDNTQPITEKEYTGADRLGVPPFNGPTCPATFLTPTSVDTVLANPTGDPLKRDAVWTKVDWTIGTLAPGSEPTIIKYVAAIPLKENTTTWAETKPSAASGKQGSNLNNNNGDSTREGTDEQTLTNYASATGTFTGTPNAPYTDRTTESVQVEDIRMQKSVDTDRFVPGNIAEFTINIDASEYMKGSEIVVTDTLPDGYCPLGAPGIGDIPEACTGGAEPTTDYASVTWNGSAYIIEFKPIAAVDANESKAITFQARMLKNYRGKSGAPTVAGDSFTNDVRLTGKTNPIAGVSSIEPGELTVKDNSEASQGTRLPTIDKQVQATRTPVNCATTTYTKTVPTFQQGDRVCFKLRVNFPNIDTKNAVVTDFLPPDSQYIAASTVPGSANTLTPPPGEPTYTDSAGPLTWTLGNTIGAGRFVDADKTFEVVFAVRLLESAGGVTPEITGNLMKMRTENTKGDAESYRDQADFTVAPPKLALVKGAIQTNKPAGLPPWPMPNNPGLDTQTVQQGSTTTFQIDVKNNEPATPAGAGSTVRGVETWDVLPSGIACSAISGYKVILPGASPPPTDLTDYVTCEQPPPPVNGQSVLSYIKWNIPTSATNYAIQPGKKLSLFYDMTIPAQLNPSTAFTNTAHVRSFDTATNDNGTTKYYPADNIDPGTESMENAPKLQDDSRIRVGGTSVAKTATTSVTEANNNQLEQATVGETITYTYSVTIPAGSTVFNAVLSDALPAGIVLKNPFEGSWKLVGATDQPAGFTFDNTGKLTFPTSYSTGDTAQTFEVTVKAQVTQEAISCPLPASGGTAAQPCLAPGTTQTAAKENTATFTRTGAVNPQEAKYTVDIVQPNPSVKKQASPTKMDKQDDVITYTLTAENESGRPPLHDAKIVDCLPIPFKATQTPTTVPANTGTVTSGAQAGGCAGWGIVWNIAKIDPGASLKLEYRAKADGPLESAANYTNTATLTGTSMAGTIDGERTYKAEAQASVTAPTLGIEKSSSPDPVTIGQDYTSVIKVNLNAGVRYYSAGVVDTLPPGVVAPTAGQVSIACTYTGDDDPDANQCSTPTSSFLTEPPSKIGWAFGDVSQDDRPRTIAITYTSRVADVPVPPASTPDNKAGVTLTNSAQPFWSSVAIDPVVNTIAGLEGLPNKLPPVTSAVTIAEPKLSIVKKVDGVDEINAVPGQNFVYRVAVTNSNDANVSTAYGIKIVDTVPAGVVVVGNPSDGGVLSNGGRTITWNLDPLGKNASKELSYTARLQPPLTSPPGEVNVVTIDEYFSLSADETNLEIREYSGPDADAKVTPVLPVLTITKTATSGPLAYIDEPYTWTMEISNNSQATAYNFGVKDTMPTNWVYVTGSSTLGGIPIDDPAASGLNLTWSGLGNLDKDKKVSLQYQAKPTAAVVDDPGVGLGIGNLHINKASTNWDQGPAGQQWPTKESSQATADTQIASADLMLEKTHKTVYPDEWNVEPDEVVPGTEFDWNINVTNNGPDNSVGPFVVTDTLPVGTEYKSYSGSDWTCNQDQVDEQKITCTHPDVAPNGLAKDESLPALTLVVKVDAAVTDAPLTNTATVTGKTYDPKPENNTDEDPVTPRPLADLAIEKSRTKPYVVGNQVTYTLAVTNLGPSVSVKDITVVDTLPTGLSIASIDAGPWQCQPTSGETDTLTCVLKQDLQPLEQAPLINVTVDVLESPGTEAVNTAVVTGTTEDPNPKNNKDEVTDPVVSEVQLGIAKKTTGANPVTAGQSTEFTITVSNFGPAKAKNVVVVDELQAGLKATSATGPGWTCDVGSGTTVTCTRANFPLSASPSDIVVKADVDRSVPGGTTLKNVATVTTTSPQPGGNPDPATSTVDVVAKSDLAVVKTHNGGPWTIGRTGTWNVRVVNNGPSDNPGPITVVDNLPRGNEFLSASGDGWSCTAAGRTVTCIYGAGLVVGQEAGFSIRVSVVNGAAPAVVNPAEVTSPIEDTDPSNNKATDRVRVKREKQTADKLPPDPSVLPARKTEQGQKIRTKVRCRTLKSSAAGEVSFCKITRKKNGTVKVKVVGNRPVKVTVIQRARGTKNFKAFKRVKTYIVRP